VVRRIDVQPDDLLEFGRKLRVVGQLELPHAMRLKTMCTPYPLHRADADREKRTPKIGPGAKVESAPG
jgi:hypothetical protein